MTENTHSVEKVMNIGNYESIRWQGGGKTAKAAVKALREMEALITPKMVMNENTAQREKLQEASKKVVHAPKVAASSAPKKAKVINVETSKAGDDEDF